MRIRGASKDVNAEQEVDRARRSTAPSPEPEPCRCPAVLPEGTGEITNLITGFPDLLKLGQLAGVGNGNQLISWKFSQHVNGHSEREIPKGP